MKPNLNTLAEQLTILMGQLSTLTSEINSIKEVSFKNKETSERLEQNWDKDRKDFRDFESRLSHLEVEVKAVTTLLAKIPNLTRDSLAEAAEPILSGAQDLKNVIADKKMVAIDTKKVAEQKKIKSWWKFWRKK